MSAPDTRVEQPETFAFTEESMARAQEIIARYPEGRQASAVVPLLDLAQRQSGGWLPRAAMEYVAGLLGMAHIRVYEVGTFYSMLNLEPVGRKLVRVCTTTPCWLCGSDDVLNACRKTLGIDLEETSADGEFTLMEVECLGACVNAPVMQVNGDYYEDLNAESATAILEALKKGESPKPGSQNGRRASAPARGLTTLTGLFGESG